MMDLMNNGAMGNGAATGAADNTGLVFDLTSVDENSTGGDFEPLPKGIYNAVCEQYELTESKSSGAPMFAATFVVDGGEFDGRKLFDYAIVGPRADGKDNSKAIEFGQAKLKKFLVRCCPEVQLAAFNAQQFSDMGTGIGKRLRLSVGIQTQKTGEYKGEKRNTIKDILAPEVGSFM